MPRLHEVKLVCMYHCKPPCSKLERLFERQTVTLIVRHLAFTIITLVGRVRSTVDYWSLLVMSTGFMLNASVFVYLNTGIKY